LNIFHSKAKSAYVFDGSAFPLILDQADSSHHNILTGWILLRIFLNEGCGAVLGAVVDKHHFNPLKDAAFLNLTFEVLKEVRGLNFEVSIEMKKSIGLVWDSLTSTVSFIMVGRRFSSL
jgi:hypothetical protein